MVRLLAEGRTHTSGLLYGLLHTRSATGSIRRTSRNSAPSRCVLWSLMWLLDSSAPPMILYRVMVQRLGSLLSLPTMSGSKGLCPGGTFPTLIQQKRSIGLKWNRTASFLIWWHRCEQLTRGGAKLVMNNEVWELIRTASSYRAVSDESNRVSAEVQFYASRRNYSWD